jgi:hypothetical protein
MQMRRSLKTIGMLLMSATIITCNQDPDRILFKGPDFVFFDTTPQLSVYENQTNPLIIPLKVSQAQAANTSVTFEVIGTNLLPGSDYVLQTPTPVQILRGKFEADISIQPKNNNVIQTEIRTLLVRIKSTDNPALTPQVISEVLVTILDDDCLPTVPKISIWVGKVSIAGGSSTAATGTGAGGNGGICGGTLAVTGLFFGSNFPTSSLTVIMTQGTTDPTKGLASVARTQLFSSTTQYDYTASGTYDETAKTITLNFTVYDTTDNNSIAASGTHIITPQ